MDAAYDRDPRRGYPDLPLTAFANSPAVGLDPSPFPIAAGGRKLRLCVAKHGSTPAPLPALDTRRRMDLHFNCTLCGRCCQNLKLPLTVGEAIEWLARGHPVQVICDAMPWPGEPAVDDLQALHRRRRSFLAKSGSMTSSVVVILAANLAGRCPNLGSDLRCGLYERRPLVCRIYPAEINPFVRLDPRHKACPPEAWTADQPLIQREGRLVDAGIRENIERSRDADRSHVGVKQRVCRALNIDSAALANEGFVVHSPDQTALQAELTRAAADPAAAAPDAAWRFVSNRSESVAALVSQGAIASLPADCPDGSGDYLGFR